MYAPINISKPDDNFNSPRKTFFFQAKDAQPPIEAFFPKQVYTEENEVTLNCLEKAVDSLNVFDAMSIYRLLTAKNETIPDNLKQNLFELACFYNHKDPLPFEMFEERGSVEKDKRERDAMPETWIENSFADQFFESLDPKTSTAYNTMIRALFKYNNNKRAEQLFNEANEKEIPLDLATYNVFIRNLNKTGASTEMRWKQIKATLKSINDRQIKPNVHTLNAILFTLKGGHFFDTRKYAAQAIAEFQSLDIEPSLETYVHLLDIFHGKQSPPSGVIYQIVERLEKNPELKAQSPDDLLFFFKMMVVCRHRLNNGSPIARRIDNIVTHSDNIKFLGDSKQESVYYRIFLDTILHNESFADFIRTYDELVPETYSLDEYLAREILATININGTIQYVPKFWTDMVIAGLTRRKPIEKLVLTLMSINIPVAGVAEYDGLGEKFAEIAWCIYQNMINEQLQIQANYEMIPAEDLSSIIVLLLRAGRHNDAKTIVESCIEQGKSKQILGCLTAEATDAFINSCIENKNPRIATQCLTYSVENGIGNAIENGRKIIESFTLESHEIKRITDLVGPEALKATVSQPQ